MNIKETEVECVDWIRLVQNSTEQQTLANIAHHPPTYTIISTQFNTIIHHPYTVYELSYRFQLYISSNLIIRMNETLYGIKSTQHSPTPATSIHDTGT